MICWDHNSGSQGESEKKADYNKRYYEIRAKKQLLDRGEPVWLYDNARKVGVCQKPKKVLPSQIGFRKFWINHICSWWCCSLLYFILLWMLMLKLLRGWDIELAWQPSTLSSHVVGDGYKSCCWRWLQVVYKTVIDVDLLSGTHHKLNIVHDWCLVKPVSNWSQSKGGLYVIDVPVQMRWSSRRI